MEYGSIASHSAAYSFSLNHTPPQCVDVPAVSLQGVEQLHPDVEIAASEPERVRDPKDYYA